MTSTVHEPDKQLSDPSELLLGYLDYYRAVIAAKVAGMGEAELRSSRLPSGWSPLELVKHLVYMEQRWLRWGFQGEQVAEPWGDWDEERTRWLVRLEETVAELLGALRAGGEHTRQVVTGTPLSASAAGGGRFAEGDARPTLGWILFHVLQEYARHAGHLDIVRELTDGVAGE
ncbi:hypothetical protein CFP65_0586 [Kitasatospora sp. MMS16-BH015]|uniref:DinB family protein n=1 Tax=Kitasatospora sp. MMS16-BH015 TaxID=2018025 RepID=UPI000CA3D253|nr:DinB family protein [Kitasatospora sp. MMS16-BH015]AUG75545.1 hypothetical protein CFP65_0586 [Kitasatospora sp. MMS16-BH015]